MENIPWNELRDVVDAMASAISACADGEWSQEDMWLELESQAQNLAHLAAQEDAEDDDLDEDEDAVKEINFDDEGESDMLEDFEDDESFN